MLGYSRLRANDGHGNCCMCAGDKLEASHLLTQLQSDVDVYLGIVHAQKGGRSILAVWMKQRRFKLHLEW